ncbi:DnaJ-domain-containing protein [Rickenella mellea]|uniref:DnaJ-domain-containing protein n=1 Tax=Rickenella mellea TaxID=50990 RepID=A0A4Y7QB12_9AGAM|nr:DnaJ-domain-containing protein [Rickenella mellea]
MSVPEDEEKWKDKEFLYTVLNLPVTASAQEIRERYRALSVVFHPDKQHDERTKDTAATKFYETQRAYEVLSDPFLREVYDTLGNEGLKLKLPSSYRELTTEELRKALKNAFNDAQVAELESRVHSQGRVVCGLDMSPLFRPASVAKPWHIDFAERWRQTRVIAFGVRHSFEKEISPQMKVTLIGRMSQGSNDESTTSGIPKGDISSARLQGNFTANIRHQYSPQLRFEGSANLLRRHSLNMSAVYSDGENSITASTQLDPRSSTELSVPPITLALGRRLFRDSFTHGTVAVGVQSGRPVVQVGLMRPVVLLKDGNIVFGWTCGVNLKPLETGPSFNAEWVVYVKDLALQVKVGSEVALIGGAGSYMTGEWSNETKDTSVGATVSLSIVGVSLRLRLSHLGQSILLPIGISNQYNPQMALLGTVIPTVAFLLADHFILKPKRIESRLARRRAVRQEFKDQISEKKRQAEESNLLLRDVAKRHTQAERDGDGLVILHAVYVPVEARDQPVLGLSVDVTIPLQALVHNAQLYIPGNRPKYGLPGFYDPLPEFHKKLQIRYEFRGRSHYAEVADLAPVVLPLQDHLVEKHIA